MSGKVILITGASKGLGLACARILLSNKFGASVVTISRSRTSELDKLAEEYGKRLTILQGDISLEQVTSNAVSTAVKTYGSLDGLVLNAGTLHPLGRISSTSISTLSEWRNVFEINFFSLVHTVQAALPHLRKAGGRIVFVSSGAATGNISAWGPYNATKAAMNSFARTLANEEPDIVSVAVRPGMVDTGMQSVLREIGASEMHPHEHQIFLDVHSSSKLVKPEQSGHVLASLAVSASKDLSGKFVTWNGEECAPHRQADSD
jgi:NAD(P)-dependent dehydrogenase (short-subunit alcohol dehydrogenase family)